MSIKNYFLFHISLILPTFVKLKTKKMANYDIRPLQLRILKILLAFDKICHKYQLHYCIMNGTMIGAIRHNGFIPWDDDIDIGLPRSDYEKLINHCKEWLIQPFEFVCAENDPLYPLPFGKIQDASTTLIERKHLSYLGGIYIDVFPLDGVPNNPLVRRWHFAQYEFLKQALYLVHRDPYKHGHGISSWIPILTRKLFTMSKLQHSIRKVLTKYSFEQSSLIADYTEGLSGVRDKSIYSEYAEYSFEGETITGIKHYDQYLTLTYGDYMKIPDNVHKRQHNFYYLDLNMPYQEYKKHII